jgi:hypothetical protein
MTSFFLPFAVGVLTGFCFFLVLTFCYGVWALDRNDEEDARYFEDAFRPSERA